MRLIEELEQQLDSFSSAERKQALMSLCKKVAAGEITLPEVSRNVNMHCHTFFSYNTYGYSPSKFAWLARKAGLAAAQVVDFDVLDAVEEFLDAAKMLNLKGCGGMETRVFVPEFADKVINSPGEPGISYHMGVGFPGSNVPEDKRKFLLGLKETAQQRNRDLIVRVNKYLEPLSLDYQQDVLPLTPSNNPTERHICLAYARKAQEIFDNEEALADFWSEKLGTDAPAASCEARAGGLPEGRNLLNTIRARTMKRGGVGYMQPDKGSFPTMADMNRFILAAGAIPTMTWLDGTSDGEKAIEELLQIAMSTGAAALNVIPDRNYTPGSPDVKLQNLYHVVELAEKLHLPLVAGTEMNSPGQKFVDDFASEELASLMPAFLKGAHIVYAHSVLQQKCGLGYTSEWAKESFTSVEEKNKFFQQLGSVLEPQQEDKLLGLSENSEPQEILNKINV